jgi:hypothetical protein
MANPHNGFTLGSHVWFGNQDFICTRVDYDLVLLPPSIDIDAIFEAPSSLCLGRDEGQAPKNDYLRGSQGQTMPVGKPCDYRRARG